MRREFIDAVDGTTRPGGKRLANKSSVVDDNPANRIRSGAYARDGVASANDLCVSIGLVARVVLSSNGKYEPRLDRTVAIWASSLASSPIATQGSSRGT